MPLRFSSALLPAVLLLAFLPHHATAQTLNYQGTRGLESTNGSNVAVGPANDLHLVYVELGQVFYRQSTDSISWTVPELVSGVHTECMHPTIAVDSSGRVGVAFTTTVLCVDPKIRYAHKSGASWSAPFLVGDGDYCSMVNRGGNVHLAWESQTQQIHYWTFPTNAPTSYIWFFGNSVVTDDFFSPPVHYDCYRPSIGITPSGQIFVAHLVHIDQQAVGGGFPPFLTGMEVRFESGTSPWSTTYSDLQSHSSSVTYFPLSCSLAISPESEHFVAYSDDYQDGAGFHPQTSVMQNSGGVAYGPVSLSAERTFVDVAARSSLGGSRPNFRVSYNEFDIAGEYGNTYFRTGLWHNGAVAPSWSHGLRYVNNRGRDPQSLFWTRGACSRYIVFDWNTPLPPRRIAFRGSMLCNWKIPPVTVINLPGGTSALRVLEGPTDLLLEEVASAEALELYRAQGEIGIGVLISGGIITNDGGSATSSLELLPGEEELVDVGEAIVESGAELEARLQLGGTLLAAEDEMGGGLGAGEAMQVFALQLNKLSRELHPEDLDAIQFAAGAAVTALEGSASLEVLNLVGGQEVSLRGMQARRSELGPPGLDLTASIEGLARLQLPVVVAIARDTGSTRGLEGAGELSINGMPVEHGGRLLEGDGDDYWFAAILDTRALGEPQECGLAPFDVSARLVVAPDLPSPGEFGTTLETSVSGSLAP